MLFFFSSRRRHTRSLCDWSSDVCSSDLQTCLRERLQHADDELLLRAGKFVRAIGRDLKPLVDSYEMTTGQPVGEIYCAYLPAALSWIAEPLAHVVGRAARQSRRDPQSTRLNYSHTA